MLQNIIEKKELILTFIKDRRYKPMKVKEMAAFMMVPKEDRSAFKELIDSLIREGKVIIDTKGCIKIAAPDTYTGIFSGTSRGFGFVKVDSEAFSGDVFIAPHDIFNAHDKDKVLIKIKPHSSGQSPEGVILQILERSTDAIIGTFEKEKSFGFVICDNQRFGSDIYIPQGFTKGAVTGSKVEVEIVDYGDERRNPEGHIIDVLGHINDPGTDLMSVVRAYGIPYEFPQEVLTEISSIPETVSNDDKAFRIDLRNKLMITIDGEDAKDLDDAVSLEVSDGIYHLGVHIADVSHYVKEHSALDKEALKRGTSNYLIDSVIPMLPRELSNGICSLNAGEDRLALSVLMDIDNKGNVISHEIAETLINVDYRMNYTSVNKIITYNDAEEIEKYPNIIYMLKNMHELALKLRAKRFQRGSIDFDFPESKIIVDKNGKPVQIKAYERNNATRLIEDFMLIANETVAEDYFWQELPFEYRTHDTPDPEKMKKLGVFINNLGYTIKLSNDEIHPKELQKLLEKIQGREEENLISRLTLRSLKQAKYTTSCDGHFGLAAKYYCHFTSPIRRYPDLQIHRIIKENLAGKLTEKRISHYAEVLPEVCALNCRTERRADEAEREAIKLKKVEYMSSKLGECFDGVISGISSKGMFVELPNTVEGFVDISGIHDDYYYFDEAHYMLIGDHLKKRYALGQRVKVKLIKTDKMTRSISFSIIRQDEE